MVKEKLISNLIADCIKLCQAINKTQSVKNQKETTDLAKTVLNKVYLLNDQDSIEPQNFDLLYKKIRERAIYFRDKADACWLPWNKNKYYLVSESIFDTLNIIRNNMEKK